jgi:hypothetical protein
MKALFVLIALVVSSCYPILNPVPTGTASCSSVCENGRSLKCDFAKDSPGGALCEDNCLNIQESGIVSWDLDCMTAAGSCSEIDRCNP